MPIDLNSFVWASMGIEPPTPEDAIYAPGEQPIAGFDNYITWALSRDLHDLTEWAGNHGSVHEAGGGQPIDLAGLPIGSAGSLNGDGSEFQLEYDGTPYVRIEPDTDTIHAWPEFVPQTTHRGGIAVGQDIERSGGSVVYDYNDDYFHRAYEADEADTAGWADDAGLLDGNPPSEFLQSDEEAEITVPWAFTEALDTDILGHAASADTATTADWADAAGVADNAKDSEALEGNDTQDILDMVDVEGSVAVEDDSAPVTGGAATLSFDDSIDVEEKNDDTVGMSVTSVPHANNAEYAENSNRVDGHHAQDLIDLAASRAGDDGRWIFIDDWRSGGVNETVNWDVDIEDEYEETWDIYKLVIVHENQQPTGGSRAIDFNINSDFRFRYNQSQELHVESGNSSLTFRSTTGVEIDLSKTVTVDNNNSSWEICPSGPEKRSVAEYKIACPPAMYDSGQFETENKPHIAAESYSGAPNTSGVLQNGELDSAFDDIHAFSLSTDHYAQTYVQLWGTKLNIN